ncbi:hypothetical protein BDD43_2520 [Mucilaginibacter gracilis]|uniref:Lipoprotein n=2 Tax=Mucilaginibacter gracilis TaxID=423350 RepID=A0A495J215_9SPHI|nr:hypothetical protein BDD43_2520 [Mucilaginibacter gracilis]
MKTLKYIPLLLLLMACHQQQVKTTIVTDSTKVVTKVSSPVDTNLITQPCAVVIEPSIKLIDKVKKRHQNKEDYNTIVDDNVYYMSQSEHYLDSVKAKKVERDSEGAITFKTLRGQTYVMKLDTIFFGVMLFNGKGKPIMADITDLQADYQKYMKE